MIGVSFGECQGWFHRAAGSRAVLLLGPHGFEDLCARRSLRHLAERLVEAHHPVLRFDYPGCGDSAGSETDAGLVARWRASVLEAAHWLNQQSGVREIVVIGLRLGALLGGLEAARIPRLRGLALLAPVTSGKLYGREMKVLAKVMRPPNAVVSDGDVDSSMIDVCGFGLSAETAQDLAKLDLSQMTLSQPASVLIMAQKGAQVTGLRRAIELTGSEVRVAEFVGYEDMICDPTASKIPVASVDEIVAWAQGLGASQSRTVVDVSPSSLEGDTWVETALTFGPTGWLAGILTTPSDMAPNASPVIFLNSGMSHHVGWSRMTVRFARELAAQGIPTLRYDAPGIGDSLALSLDAQLPLYDQSAEDALTAAVSFVEGRFGRAVTVVGLCSGAYSAFHVTTRDSRIAKAVIANLQCFAWTEALGFEVERWREVRRSVITAEKDREAADQQGAGSLSATLRSVGFKALRAVGRPVKRYMRSRAKTSAGAVELSFLRLSERKTQVALVYSEGDQGLDCLASETGVLGERVTRLPGVSLTLIPNADHNLTARAAQDHLLGVVRSLAGGDTVRATGLRPAAALA